MESERSLRVRTIRLEHKSTRRAERAPELFLERGKLLHASPGGAVTEPSKEREWSWRQIVWYWSAQPA